MKKILIMTLIAATGALTSCRQTQQADLIIHNALIYTVNDSFETVSSMAIRDGIILATGTDEAITKNYRSEEVVDMGGKPVYPGFYDAHCHFNGYAANLRRADLVGTGSFEEVGERLVKHQEEFPSDWVLGRGWDQNDWPGQQFPKRDLLDRLFPDKPVYLIRIDGHAAVVNSAALEIASINDQTTVIGGEIIRDNGRITGVLVDNAMDLVSRHIPEMEENEVTRVLLEAQEDCFAVGLTSVADAGLDYETVMLMDSLHQTGDLKMRIYAMLTPTQENFENFINRGLYKTDHLNVRSVKLFADGALGSRGALMLEPYSDAPGKSGLQVSSTEYLTDICRKSYEAGYQVETHCIGDGANRLMLNIYKEILGGKNDRRWRIEHAQIVHPDDFDLFGQFSIIPSIQTTHATSDMYWAADRVGPERIKGAYAYRQLMEQNGWIPNGSDFPIEHINPIFGFYAAFARMDQSGYPEGGWQMENALTREQALRAMTIWAARSCFEENERGSLEPGKMADFVVLEKDLMATDTLQVPKIQVLETWINGKKVFERCKH